MALVWLSAFIVAAISAMAILGYSYAMSRYQGGRQWVCVPKDADGKSIRDSLVSSLGDDFGMKVYRLWSVAGGDASVSYGAYAVDSGVKAIALSRSLVKGRQTPKRVIFNNIRTISELARRVSSFMEWDAYSFLEACDSVLPQAGFCKQEYPAAFLPDTYEFYWNDSPVNVVALLLECRNRFWNASRREKANRLGLSPVGVATIASIVEEETSKPDERPMVARLYLNRLSRGMKLQADPTIKFAIGDFSLRRITGEHLKVQSPYNTYQHAGLPPGPIRIADKTTLDDVLDAPEHPYLYMCAKSDFSGYHDFSADYASHLRNAARYRAELNRRGIKK